LAGWHIAHYRVSNANSEGQMGDTLALCCVPLVNDDAGEQVAVECRNGERRRLVAKGTQHCIRWATQCMSCNDGADSHFRRVGSAEQSAHAWNCQYGTDADDGIGGTEDDEISGRDGDLHGLGHGCALETRKAYSGDRISVLAPHEVILKGQLAVGCLNNGG